MNKTTKASATTENIKYFTNKSNILTVYHLEMNFSSQMTELKILSGF